MLCFLLPKSFCNELEDSMARCWWQKSAERRGIHWCTGWWDGILRSFKVQYYIVDKTGVTFVNALGILDGDVSLKRFLHVQLGSNPSLIWRSIWSARKLLEIGMQWKVGTGRRINIWDKYWLPSPIPQKSPIG
ncbi:reverse transcriptase [Gossypium australe]|uniref:Reverse transcriptase n=1 Tax=Gossypium australe TaxID=47621 RepID=A0A5B6X2R2_9ROSI|nr:reverse transcriptase [Gossypium australe]